MSSSNSDPNTPSSKSGEQASSWPERPFSKTELDEMIGRIDLGSVEVDWAYADMGDPYGIGNEKWDCVGRESYVIDPATGHWIWFGDLPKAMRDALSEKFGRKLLFPAGLPKEWFTGKEPEGDFD